MTERNAFQQQVDRTLSHLQWTERQKQQVLHAADGERRPIYMKKKLMTGIALAICLCLMTGAAYATYVLHYSPEATARKVAVAALEQQYGLDAACLGLFTSHTREDEQGLWVFYDVRSELPFQLVGYYNVLVKDGKATITWSHDEIDPALWQSGSLDAPAWGAPQLKQLLAASPLERYALVEPHMNRETSLSLEPMLDAIETADVTPTVAPTSSATAVPTQGAQDRLMYWPIQLPTGHAYAVIVAPGEGDISLDDACSLAVQAFTDTYALTAEQLNQAEYNYSNQLVVCQGQRIWVVGMLLNDGDICFTALVDASTGMVIDTYVNTGGNG